jgi:predicted nucleotidyltransferase
MRNKILDVLEKNLNIKPYEVSNIYLYGSQCYGTQTETSDYDFTIVTDCHIENGTEFTIGDYNFHIHNIESFRELLDKNDPKSIECLSWARKDPILERVKLDLNITKPKLRHAVSQISSNSWVKARKKIDQGDISIGQKSLFHSLRIPMYATQIMEDGDITNWGCANSYWEEIKQIDDWKVLKDKYQPIRSKIMTDFRKLCPK